MSGRTKPPGHTKTCSACGAKRGNTRKGWHFVNRDDDDGKRLEVGATCPACPEWGEPVRRLPDGRFRAVVDSTPAGARKRRQATRTLDTLDGARAFVAEVRADVEQAGAWQAPATETVAELFARWLDSHRDVRQVTREGYANAAAPVLRRIGGRDVATITRRDIESLVGWMEREGGRRGQALGARSVRAALIPLGAAFDLAVEEGTLERNPVRAVKPPRTRKRVGTDLEHWQPEELMAWRAVADSDQLAGAWRLTACGLTRADVMGLRWTDCDLDAGVVSILQGRVALDRGDATDEPKSDQRLRSIAVDDVHAGTIALLRALKRSQAADKLKAGAAYRDSGYVVVDAAGQPLRPEVYSDRFRRLCDAAGVPRIHLHSVRHSLAFWLHKLGVSPADAAAWLGHSTEIHLQTYLPHSGTAGITTSSRTLGKDVRRMARTARREAGG